VAGTVEMGEFAELAAKTRVEPSGDHDGESPTATCSRAEPSAGVTQTVIHTSCGCELSHSPTANPPLAPGNDALAALGTAPATNAATARHPMTLRPATNP
jgi:hypothetical protein